MDTTSLQEGLSDLERSDLRQRCQKFKSISARTYSLEECQRWVEKNNKEEFRGDKSNFLAAIQQNDAPAGIEMATNLFEFYFADDEVERSKLKRIWEGLTEHKDADSRGLAMLLRQLGQLETSQGNLAGGQAYLAEAIQLQERMGDKLMLGNDYYELGMVYRNSGSYQLAREAFNKSIQYAREAGNLKTVIYSQGQLANILAVQSQFEEAIAILKESLQTWTQFPKEADRDMRHTTLHTLGRTYLQNGQYNEAKDVLLESLQLKEKLQERFDAILRTRAILTEVFLNLGDLEKAGQYLTEDIAQKGETIGSYLYTASAFKALSQLNFAQRKYAEAKRLGRRAMDVAVKSNTPLTEFEVVLWLLSLDARRFDLIGFVRDLPRFFGTFFRLRLSPVEILKLATKRLTVILNPMGRQFGRR